MASAVLWACSELPAATWVMAWDEPVVALAAWSAAAASCSEAAMTDWEAALILPTTSRRLRSIKLNASVVLPTSSGKSPAPR